MWKFCQTYGRVLFPVRLAEVIFERSEIISNASQSFTVGTKTKLLEKMQSVKLGMASLIRDMLDVMEARTELVIAGHTAVAFLSKGRHLMSILRIPGDY